MTIRKPHNTDDPTAEDRSDGSAEQTLQWALFLVHHDRELVSPQRFLLSTGQEFALHRGEGPLGDLLRRDDRVSRKHALLRVDSAGALLAIDEGSRNGMFVNGDRTTQRTLAPGDVLRVGGALFVAARTLATYPSCATVPLLGPGPSGLALAAQLRAAVRSASILLLTGEPGFTTDPLIAFFTREGRAPAQLDARSVSTAQLDVATAHDLLLVRNAQSAARALLTRLTQRSSTASSLHTILLWNAAPGERVPADPTLDPILRQATVTRVAIPPLRTRPEDLCAMLALRALHRSLPVPLLSHATVTRMLRAAWPGNEAQFEVVADALLEGALSADLEMLLHESWDAALAAMNAQQERMALPPSKGEWEFSSSGRWFCESGGERVSLAHRPILARMLAALVEAHQEAPTRTLDVDALTRAAWPGTKFVEDSAFSRVYVAISTLRRMGLRDVLVREEKGYRLASEKRLRVTLDRE